MRVWGTCIFLVFSLVLVNFCAFEAQARPNPDETALIEEELDALERMVNELQAMRHGRSPDLINLGREREVIDVLPESASAHPLPSRESYFSGRATLRTVAPERDARLIPNIPQRQVVAYPETTPNRGGVHFTVSKVLLGPDYLFDLK